MEVTLQFWRFGLLKLPYSAKGILLFPSKFELFPLMCDHAVLKPFYTIKDATNFLQVYSQYKETINFKIKGMEASYGN